jgi:hypothetical protein
MKWRVMILESYVQATLTFLNDHAQNLNSPDVFLSKLGTYWRVIISYKSLAIVEARRITSVNDMSNVIHTNAQYNSYNIY